MQTNTNPDNVTRIGEARAPYGVLKMGPKVWYVQALRADGQHAEGDIVGITFTTKRGATSAATSRNEIRGWTGPVPTNVSPFAS